MYIIQVCNAVKDDVSALCNLVDYLGYKTGNTDMEIRFNNIEAHPDYFTLVSEIEGKVVGMAGITINYSYEKTGNILEL